MARIPAGAGLVVSFLLIGSGAVLLLGSDSTAGSQPLRGPAEGDAQVVTVTAAGRHTVTFTYHNDSQVAVTAPSLRKSCGCIKATFEPEVLPPGKVGRLLVTTDTATDSDGSLGTVHLTWSNQVVTKVMYRIVGQRIAGISAAPARLDWSAIRDREWIEVSYVADYHPAAVPADFVMIAAIDGRGTDVADLGTIWKQLGSNATTGVIRLRVAELEKCQKVSLWAPGQMVKDIPIERSGQ